MCIHAQIIHILTFFIKNELLDFLEQCEEVCTAKFGDCKFCSSKNARAIFQKDAKMQEQERRRSQS